MELQLRYDLATLRGPVFHDEGFATVDAYITRVGVFEYVMPDGTVRLELRPPDEVFDEASLETLKGKPVTDGHPDEPVNSENVAKYQVGANHSDVTIVDGYVRVSQTIHRQEAIDSIKNGRREESCGYFVKIDDQSGVWVDTDGLVGPKGTEYPFDVIQRNIRYNHVALVDRGRAGPRVGLRADEAAAATQLPQIRFDEIDPELRWTDTERTDGPSLTGVMRALVTQAVKDADGKTRADILREMAESAEITVSAVHDHLTGAVACPPKARLSGFATVLGVDAARLIDLAEANGCSYDRTDTDDHPDDTPPKRKRPMAQITIGGLTYNSDEGVPADVVATILQENDKLEGKVDAAETQAKEATKRADAAEKERDSTKSELETLQGKYDSLKEEAKNRNDGAPDDVVDAANERLELLVIGSKLNIDGLDKPLECGKSNDELKRAIVQKASPSPNAKLDGKSADYVAGVFEHVRDSVVKSDSAFQSFAQTLHPQNQQGGGQGPQNPQNPAQPHQDGAGIQELEHNYLVNITGSQDQQ